MAKLASEYDIRLGDGLVAADSASWGRYLLITTPSAYAALAPELDHEPAGVGYNEWLDREHLIAVSDSLPDDVDLVVGGGAGRALDHAKLVAHRKGVPLVQVPTAVSTGAIIHSFVADWEGRQIVGQLAVVDCEYVLVDYGIVLQAPERLNTAGIGDVLCGYASIAEWRYGARKGTADPVDEDRVGVALGLFERIVSGFPPTLGTDGALTAASIDVIMMAVQQRDDHIVRDPNAPGADHAYGFAIEIANDKYWIHGETCALGAMIIAFRTGESPDMLAGWFDSCKVRWRPSDLEITREEFEKSIAAWPAWLGDGSDGEPRSKSIVVQEPMDSDDMDRVWSWLNSA